MGFKIKYSEQAADDIERIIQYICDELCNRQAAEHFYSEVNRKLDLLILFSD
jgi:plasmid stabilization system protein ParE